MERSDARISAQPKIFESFQRLKSITILHGRPRSLGAWDHGFHVHNISSDESPGTQLLESVLSGFVQLESRVALQNLRVEWLDARFFVRNGDLAAHWRSIVTLRIGIVCNNASDLEGLRQLIFHLPNLDRLHLHGPKDRYLPLESVLDEEVVRRWQVTDLTLRNFISPQAYLRSLLQSVCSVRSLSLGYICLEGQGSWLAIFDGIRNQRFEKVGLSGWFINGVRAGWLREDAKEESKVLFRRGEEWLAPGRNHPLLGKSCPFNASNMSYL